MSKCRNTKVRTTAMVTDSKVENMRINIDVPFYASKPPSARLRATFFTNEYATVCPAGF
jgi:hypothetical protein